jgi:plasmid stabilization system protein ParE
LERFPLSGRVVPEFGTPYREILVGPYRVIYRYDKDHDVAFVLNVVHGSRRLPPSPDES